MPEKRTRKKKRITVVCDENRAVFYRNHERTGSSSILGKIERPYWAEFAFMLKALGYRVEVIELPSKTESAKSHNPV